MLYPMLEMLFRHRWRYLTLLVVLPLIGALICIPLFPKSTATELIWVQDQSLIGASLPSYDSYLTPAQITQGDLEQFIQTRSFATRAESDLRRQGVSASQATSIVDGLPTALVATTNGNNLLLLDYTCTHPSLCPLVLTTSWDVYEAYSASNVNSGLEVAEQAYKEQVQQAQQQLNSANAAVTGYLADHPSENPQTSTDPALTSLLQAVQTAQQTLQAAQSKLSGAQAQASSNRISVSSLYRVADPAHPDGGHLGRLPTKQMLLVAVLFWALAGLSLVLSSRLERVVRHPHQLGVTLGVEVAAVMPPIPAPSSGSLTLPAGNRGAAA